MPKNRRRARGLRAAFSAIIVLFALLNVSACLQGRRTQAITRGLVESTFASVELVSRIQHDIERRRLLLDAHIFAKDAVDMGRLEMQLAEVEDDYAHASAVYTAIASTTDARPTWNTLEREIASLEGPTQRVLALSRSNLDEEARQEMGDLMVRFEAVEHAAASLLNANHAEAERASARIHNQQQQALVFLLSLTLAGIGMALSIAIWVTRLVNRREADMAALSQRLEEQNRELDAFAGRVAHDLRGPLTAISFAASRLAQRAPAEEGTSAVLRRGVARMDGIIRDLLALSRIGVQAPSVVCDPSAIAKSATEDLRARVEEEGGALDVDVEPAIVRCSDGLLRQVLWNLVDNAVKYRRTNVPPKVEIHGAAAGTSYELSVSDNGVGMSPEDVRHAFEPFYRGARTQHTPGTGLGLSIVKRAIEASNGTAQVTSNVDQGTTFTVRLSISKRREQPREVDAEPVPRSIERC